MRYLGISLWIAFIGIAVWGNWFFGIIAMCIAGGAAIGLIAAEIHNRNEKKELKRLIKEAVANGTAFRRENNSIEWTKPSHITVRYPFSLDFLDEK